MAFVGNTQHTVPYMLKHADLFDDLPEQYHDSAFLDRIHFYIPGWEVDIIRGEMFSDGYGFVVDYLAEILRSLRNHDYSDRYQEHFTLSSDISTRDRDGIHKTFSGLMKILFPHDEASEKEIREILNFAVEGRKRVKDQLMRIDSTYADVQFSYEDRAGKTYAVKTLEEEEYPRYYNQTIGDGSESDETNTAGQGPHVTGGSSVQPAAASAATEEGPKEGHVAYQENQRGISYDELFGPYLKDARKITITDPYIRLFYQTRNLMEFMETVAKHKPRDEEVAIHLITIEDEFKGYQQIENFEKIQESCATIGIEFTWEFSTDQGLHARHIVTDTGWKILLDRGLDIFQRYEMNDAFSFANKLQQHRPCKAFEVTYLKS